jgi:hypothetical protein
LEDKMSGEKISVIVEVQDSGEETKGLFGGSRRAERRELSIETLQNELKAETEKLLAVLDGVPAKAGWKLDEVEVGVDISAESGVSFIGTATFGATASFKLRFSR